MSTKRCYYETLECQKGATVEVLKASYRKLAMRFHPDKNPDDHTAEIKFKEINEAYDVLKDDQKRSAYDRFGHAAFEGGGAGAGMGGFDFSATGDLGDIFGQMFGMGRRGGQRTRTGADLRQGIEIDLAEAFSGTKVTLRVPTRVKCETCDGTGSQDKGRAAETCPTCQGSGKVRRQSGFFLIEQTCATCGGQGRVIRNPCRICQGAGTVQRDRSLSVPIPAGVEDGTRIRLSGEGE